MTHSNPNSNGSLELCCLASLLSPGMPVERGLGSLPFDTRSGSRTCACPSGSPGRRTFGCLGDTPRRTPCRMCSLPNASEASRHSTCQLRTIVDDLVHRGQTGQVAFVRLQFRRKRRRQASFRTRPLRGFANHQRLFDLEMRVVPMTKVLRHARFRDLPFSSTAVRVPQRRRQAGW